MIEQNKSGKEANIVGEGGKSSDAINKKVLLVEDNKVARRALKMRLQLLVQNYAIDEAETVKAAVDLASRHEYVLILMDIGLPDGNGRQASQAIREIAHHKITPIIAVTAHADAKEKEECLAGELMQDVKYKPLSDVDISSLVDRYLPSIDSTT